MRWISHILLHFLGVNKYLIRKIKTILIVTSEEVNEVKNEEAPEPIINEVIETTNEEQPTEQIKEEEKTTEPIEQIKEKITEPIERPKAKATPKKLARSVKVVELVECSACNKKMLPKSLRNTHPYYCKGQPTETLPVDKQKASYGVKVEEKLRKEIEEEIKKKYETKEVINNSEHEVSRSSRASGEASCSSAALHEPTETKTKPKPSVPSLLKQITATELIKQITATELRQQSYNKMKILRQQEKKEKMNRFRASMF